MVIPPGAEYIGKYCFQDLILFPELVIVSLFLEHEELRE